MGDILTGKHYLCNVMDERKIIHIDMDAFYASVEQRDHPELRGKAIAVGHSEERGVVAAASYEARKYGVRSAMSSLKAKQLCPHLIFVPGRMSVYKEVSAQIHAIFHDYTDLIEPLSLDEAFLDVTHNKKNIPLAVDIAKEIKLRIHEELNLIASAGISYNKFLAKVASDYRKPDGLCTIHPDQAQEFIDRLPIEAFWGVGKVTAKKMHTLGIHRGKELRQCTLEMLTRIFGKAGHIYYNFARGIDLRPVEAERIRKSVGCEHTLDKDITSQSSVIIELYHVATELVERLKRNGFSGNTLTLKIKFYDFKQITRSLTLEKELNRLEDILPLAKQLLKEVDYTIRPIRLIGLTVSNPKEEQEEEHGVWKQLELEFDPPIVSS
jgi:DNA polymerase-4